jgi:protein TonB
MQKNTKTTLSMHLKSIAVGLSVFLLILISLHFLNSKKVFNNKSQKQSATKFEVIERKKITEEQIKPEKTKQRSDLAPELDSVLEGFTFGLPSLELDLNAGQSLLSGANDGVMSAQSVDVLPKALIQTEMAYPTTAAEKGIQGYVEVSLLVNDLGQVEKVNIINSNPAGIFEETTKSSVSQWRFQPAEYKGKKVAVWLNQKINFSLE